MYIELNTLLGLLIIAGIVLAVYLIVAVYNLIKTLKQTQKVLSDFEVVAEIASKRSKQLDKLIEDTSKKFKSGKNVFNTIPLVVSAITKIAGMVGKKPRKSE